MDFTINVHHTIDFSPGLKGWIMSKLDDKIAQVATQVNQAADRTTADIAALKADIANLRQQIEDGGTEPQLAALDAIGTRADQLDPATPSVLPPDAPALTVTPPAAS